MRKKTVSNFFDNWLWYTIYALPIIITIINIICNSFIHTGDFNFTFDFLNILENNLLYFHINDSLVFTTLSDLFGVNGIMPLFNNTLLLMYFSYFINCIIAHLVVDILALIPRVGHKLVDKAGK